MELQVMCTACEGTGVYIGFAEKEGASVVCSCCRGKGWVMKSYTPFTERRMREGVKTVASRNQGIVLAPGIDHGEITYEEFLAGKMPSDDKELYPRVTGKPSPYFD